jgi:hypothetical protein
LYRLGIQSFPESGKGPRQLGNHQDIAEILVKVTLNTIPLTLISSLLFDITEVYLQHFNVDDDTECEHLFALVQVELMDYRK